MAYGPSLPDMYKRTANYVDRILKGNKIAEMPIEQTNQVRVDYQSEDGQVDRP